jgi:hypothetical protein
MARPVGPFTIDQRPPTGRSGFREKERHQQRRFDILTGKPGISWDVIDKTGSKIIDIEDRNVLDMYFTRVNAAVDYTMSRLDSTVFGDASLGMVTITLPTAVGADEKHEIKKIDTSANVVRVTAFGAELVAGAAFFDLEAEGESIEIASNGSNWFA